MHQRFAQILGAHVARAAAHVVAVLGEHGVGVIAAAVEKREQPVTFRSGHLAVAHVLEERAAVHQSEGGRAQRAHLAVEVRLIRDAVHQAIVLDLPAAVSVGPLAHAAYEVVDRRVQISGHLHTRLGLFHEPRVFIRMEQHALLPEGFSSAILRRTDW